MPDSTQIIGNYEYLGILEKPRAGVTYKVRNLNTGELEALRTLAGACHGDPESLERFHREIRIHTRLSHPNVIAFHDAFELNGQLVMTTEFVEGTTFAELCRPGPLSPDQAIRAACEVLSGLEEAHALGLVHRGINAEHVMVTREGTVKLGGFGLAKPATGVNLTQVGATVGDARFMSPEQVIGVDALDGRADLYSVGVLLFYALTGRLPFDGANDFDIMLAQVNTPPPRPSSLNPAVMPELERIVLTALAKKPGDRFAGAREFRLALSGMTGTAIAKTPSIRPLPETVVPTFLPKTGPGARNRTLVVLGVIGVAVALVVLVLLAVH